MPPVVAVVPSEVKGDNLPPGSPDGSEPTIPPSSPKALLAYIDVRVDKEAHERREEVDGLRGRIEALESLESKKSLLQLEESKRADLQFEEARLDKLKEELAAHEVRAWCEFRVVANTDMPQLQAGLCFNGNLIVSGGFSEALTPLHTSAISKAAVQETGAQSKTVTTVEEHAGETRGWLMWFRTWTPPLPSNY